MVDEIPYDGTEKESMHTSLDRLRDAMLWKLDGLTDEQLRRPMVPSGTSLLGLVKHLASVQFGWFGETFTRESEWIAWDPEDCDADARIRPDEGTEDIRAYFDRARTSSDAVIRGHEMDDRVETVPGLWTGETVTLRWIMIHVLEDAARHAGHMDILRELLDGSIGTFPRDEGLGQATTAS